MHKISNFTGQARHGWDKMAPSMGFGMRQPHNDLAVSSPIKRSSTSSMSAAPAPSPGSTVNLSFNIPFASNLAGPDPSEVIYASPGAFQRWTFPDDTPEDTPTYKLPVHQQNMEALRTMCRQLGEQTGGTLFASVMSSEPKPIPGLQRGPLKALVTNVCLSGEHDMVHRVRAQIFNSTPISLRCSTVEVDQGLIMEEGGAAVKEVILRHLDDISNYTKADIFLLEPKRIDIETASVKGLDIKADERYRIAIFGDMESSEHAKTRILIMIDQILNRVVDTMKLELTMHTLICGRGRKNIKLIESATNTAIYFPPPFPSLYGYIPQGAQRRSADEVIITGENTDNILLAKKRLYDLVTSARAFVKEIGVTATKIDSILLERLDKVRKIMEFNGSYVIFPQLGLQRGTVRVQGSDILNVERTIREIMALAGQFYSATWWITHPDPSQRQPNPTDIRTMLSDICINSGAEISFEKYNFTIYGSDDSVKAALMVINNIPFVKKAQYQLRVKIELANEHKEFVSGKKNGKINKIMSQSNVQIVFDGFNEYNFYIDVRGQQYEATKSGLDLVEQEMPASISFHVPDQYHKRIIGIGGQHIQRIMKKYSVFVKFSNAMDRGGVGKDDDDIKVDNVICRTPARNAQNLDLVKQEIMDMVEKVDAEFVQETVIVDRLYHRELIARMSEIEELEKKWNCKIVFPSTEQASDVIHVTGPEYQVPQCVDEFLGMVPESHEIAFPSSAALKDFLKSNEFVQEVSLKLKEQYVVDVQVVEPKEDATSEVADIPVETLRLHYTRNNEGGLKDAIDYIIARLVAHGLDATAIKGAIPRPKSDSFEESLPYFESKLLQRTEPPVTTDSPTRSTFGDDNDNRSIFDKLRKPGSISSFSSFLDRRKNGSGSPGSLFKHASSNASKVSLASLESQSSYRNIWNDSGLHLSHDDDHHHSNGWASALPTNGHNGHTPHSSTGSKFPFGIASPSSVSLTTPTAGPLHSAASNGGDTTPKYGGSVVGDGRPGTASSTASVYPAPIGPPATSSAASTASNNTATAGAKQA